MLNQNFQKFNTEGSETQNDSELKAKKKNPSSNDLSYQAYERKAFESQIAHTDSDVILIEHPREAVSSRPLPCFVKQVENSTSNNFPASKNSNLNFAFSKNSNNESIRGRQFNSITEKEQSQNTAMDLVEETCAGEAKFSVADANNQSANTNLNLNLNNFNSNNDKNLKNNSALKQNMVKARISQSPIEARKLAKPAAYNDENQMDIEVANESNPQKSNGLYYATDLTSNNLNCNNDYNNFNSHRVTNNCNDYSSKDQGGFNKAGNFATVNYAYETVSHIASKESLGKIKCVAEGKLNNNPNKDFNYYNNNNNNFNANSKVSKHNYNNYKKKSSATGAACSKPAPSNSSTNLDHPAQRQNIAGIHSSNITQTNQPTQTIQTIQTTQPTQANNINKIDNNTNNNASQISNLKTDHYAKFIPILQKHEKSIPLDYIPEIWRSLKTSENCAACMPKYEYLLNQTDINFDMRAILIDWIIDVHKNYRLFPETLYICISIIDRYLTKKQILRTRLQLLGTTALFISSKYEEIIYPCIEEFTKVTDDAYKKEEVLQMETEIFQLLEFDLTYPSPYRFFEIISLNYNFSEVEFYYGCYLLEYFLISPNSNKYFPSVIALAVVLLILKMKNYENYRDLYSLTDSLESQRLVKQCAKEIYEFPATCKSLNLFSVFNKYSDPIFHSVALNELDKHQQPSAADEKENTKVNC